MKLDYKKTIFVGMAFFVISMFWITYDNIIAKILIDKFGLTQVSSGFVMALDNILALFMLPLFGSLSDKTKSKYGRRTPYIFIGTLVAAVAFVTLSFVDQKQTERIESSTIIEEYDYINDKITLNGEPVNLTLGEWNQIFNEIRAKRSTDYALGRITAAERDKTLNKMQEDYDRIIEVYGIDKSNLNYQLTALQQRDFVDIYHNYLSNKAYEMTSRQPANFILFIGLLFIVLVAMSTFRSPAVALMPDVTIKPLRSKANAVINLLGAIGGIISTGLLLFLGLSKASYVHYTSIFLITSGLMIAGLAVFLITVNEKKLVAEYELEVKRLGLEETEEQPKEKTIGKLTKSQFKSLVFILVSVFLWFTGYNAVTTKLSDYAPKVLQMDFAIPLIIAQATAIISFIPIGILSSKFGRKKMILVGVALLTISFASASFLTAQTGWIIYIILGLTGIAWATINVNSFPMVVELATGNDVGKYTGYYYTFSMAAQIMTPLLSGAFMHYLGRGTLFPYAAFFVFASFITMLFVKHGDRTLEEDNKSLLDYFDVD